MVMILLFAASNTTSAVINSNFVHLALNKDVQRKA